MSTSTQSKRKVIINRFIVVYDVVNINISHFFAVSHQGTININCPQCICSYNHIIMLYCNDLTCKLTNSTLCFESWCFIGIRWNGIGVKWNQVQAWYNVPTDARKRKDLGVADGVSRGRTIYKKWMTQQDRKGGKCQSEWQNTIVNLYLIVTTQPRTMTSWQLGWIMCRLINSQLLEDPPPGDINWYIHHLT